MRKFMLISLILTSVALIAFSVSILQSWYDYDQLHSITYCREAAKGHITDYFEWSSRCNSIVDDFSEVGRYILRMIIYVFVSVFLTATVMVIINVMKRKQRI